MIHQFHKIRDLRIHTITKMKKIEMTNTVNTNVMLQYFFKKVSTCSSMNILAISFKNLTKMLKHWESIHLNRTFSTINGAEIFVSNLFTFTCNLVCQFSFVIVSIYQRKKSQERIYLNNSSANNSIRYMLLTNETICYFYVFISFL